MSINKQDLIALYRDARQAERAGSPLSAVKTLRRVVLDSLSPQELGVYSLLETTGEEGLTAKELAGQLDFTVEAANNLLKALADFELATRELATAREYRYWAINGEHSHEQSSQPAAQELPGTAG